MCDHDPAPFIVGTGRCGTTLLRVMLDAHPQLAIPPETHFIPEVARDAGDPHDARQRVFEAVIGSRNWGKFGIDAAAYWNVLAAMHPFDGSEGVRAFYRLYRARFGKSRWGDKTPAYLGHMRLIERLLPEARFVHLVRDGRDVALSVLPLLDRDGTRHTLEEGARWWVQRLTRGSQQAAGLTHYLEVRYEDLVEEPARALRRICEFLDLAWEPSLLLYHERAAARLAGEGSPPTTRARADWARVVSPPDMERVGRWREEMSAAEQASVEAIAGPLLRAYGYA